MKSVIFRIENTEDKKITMLLETYIYNIRYTTVIYCFSLHYIKQFYVLLCSHLQHEFSWPILQRSLEIKEPIIGH